MFLAWVKYDFDFLLPDEPSWSGSACNFQEAANEAAKRFMLDSGEVSNPFGDGERLFVRVSASDETRLTRYYKVLVVPEVECIELC